MARHIERHLVARIGWLRAAVLGANDGIVSTASLIVGVAAAGTGRQAVLVAGLAGLVAGAMSMAAGEYVSVSSQSDTEAADLERERGELAANPKADTTTSRNLLHTSDISPRRNPVEKINVLGRSVSIRRRPDAVSNRWWPSRMLTPIVLKSRSA